MDLTFLVIAVVLIGLFAGFIGGLLGVGGGIIMVPGLVILIGLDFLTAKGVSLFAITFLAMIGAYEHHRLKHVDKKMGLVIGVTGATGAVLGSYVSTLIGTTALEIIFGVTLFISATRFFVKIKERYVEGRWTWPLIGLGGGFIAGLLGLGGGVVMVQGMVYIGATIHTAVGTSMLAIVFNAIAGASAHMLLGHMDLGVAAPLTAAASLGVVLGSRYSDRVKAKILKRYFAVAMIIVGVYMVLRALDVVQFG